MSQLERWIAWAIAERLDPGQQQLLHRYAVWHVTRRLRARLARTHATHHQAVAAKRNIKATITLLDWLTAHDLTRGTAGQGDLETWLASAQATHRTDARNFVRWARKQKLTSLDSAATKWGGPTGIINTQARWEQARWLLRPPTQAAPFCRCPHPPATPAPRSAHPAPPPALPPARRFPWPGPAAR